MIINDWNSRLRNCLVAVGKDKRLKNEIDMEDKNRITKSRK
jgi:hypothetical protein